MSELEQLMQAIGEKYEIETVPCKIGDRVLKILQMKDFEEYIAGLVEKDLSVLEMPFWAKLWEASFILSFFLGKQPVQLGQRMLEIGAGLGVAGIYASLCGHNVTITDINEDALLFARANALMNGATQAKICKLDWSDQSQTEQYDVIFGSEVIYDRRSYPMLVDFLRRTLAPNGIIFLAKHEDLKAPAFFEELTKQFEFKQTSQPIRTSDGNMNIILYAIRPKEGAAVSGSSR